MLGEVINWLIFTSRTYLVSKTVYKGSFWHVYELKSQSIFKGTVQVVMY